MPQHIDRNASRKAIEKLIAAEKATIANLKQQKKEREAEHLPTDHLDTQIQDENEQIKGKEEILEIVLGFGQLPLVDELLEFEAKLLARGEEGLAGLRRQEPKPVQDIDELQRLVERLKKRIVGKNEAKGALVL